MLTGFESCLDGGHGLVLDEPFGAAAANTLHAVVELLEEEPYLRECSQSLINSLAEDITDALERRVILCPLIDFRWANVQHEHIRRQDGLLSHEYGLLARLWEVLKDPPILLNVALSKAALKQFDEVIVAEGLALAHGANTQIECVYGISADVTFDYVLHVKVDGIRLLCNSLAQSRLTTLRKTNN